MISTIDSQYPISLVKIDPLTLELLPLFARCLLVDSPFYWLILPELCRWPLCENSGLLCGIRRRFGEDINLCLVKELGLFQIKTLTKCAPDTIETKLGQCP